MPSWWTDAPTRQPTSIDSQPLFVPNAVESYGQFLTAIDSQLTVQAIIWFLFAICYYYCWSKISNHSLRIMNQPTNQPILVDTSIFLLLLFTNDD